jgi:hypothetical protein
MRITSVGKIKKILHWLFLPLAIGCGPSREELVDNYRKEYFVLNCDQLKREHISIEKMKQDEEESVAIMNAVNVTVGLVGILCGAGSFHGTGSKNIEKYDQQLEAISSLMSQKKCHKLTMK